MQKNLFKKGVAFAVIILFIGIAITPICAAQSATNITENINNKSLGLGHYFGLEGDIKFSYNETTFRTPIIPLTGEVTAPISVSYKVTGILANLIIRLIAGRRDMEIALSIEDVPEYATARVTPNNITPRINSMWESAECYVHISVNEAAPAYETSYFTLKATSVSIKGPLGLLTLIHDAEHVQEIPFVPAYLPIIHVIPENLYIETPPGEITNLSFLYENLGNGLTKINAEIIEIPSDDWWCYIQPETVLGVGESKNVPFFILPPGNFSGREDIRLAFIGSYYYDPSQHTDTYIVHITVHYKP